MALDPQTVVQILLRERVRLSASVIAILRDHHAADDVFQQVVLQALQSCGQFREPEHVLAWALRTARHRALDILGKSRPQCLDNGVLRLLEEQWASVPATEVSARVEALQGCLERLPEQARQLLRLRYEDGLSCSAVARRLRNTVAAVYQSLSRVHRQLRLCVERRLAAADQGSVGGAFS
jgi:RNA polymerase sigma-70 factor (ECF subfamily)